MARAIGKCLTCKTTTARDYTETQSVTTGNGMYARKVNVAGRTVHGVFIRASKDFQCQACGAHQWNGKMIQGVVTDHKCNAKCMNSKSHICECACGGENHGKGFIVCEAVAA